MCLLRFVILYLTLCAVAAAQQSERFGPYELHYSVVNTTFLDPAVAARHHITRGQRRAIINLALREHRNGETLAIPMLLQGRTWDLIQNSFLDFREIREGDAIYYIADFRFINEEWRFFEIDFRPEGGDRTHTLRFRQQLYID